MEKSYVRRKQSHEENGSLNYSLHVATTTAHAGKYETKSKPECHVSKNASL